MDTQRGYSGSLREGEGQSHDKCKPMSAAGDQGQGAEVMSSSGDTGVWLRPETKTRVATARCH